MSIITGYPISDRELDLAYENESAKLWESLQPEAEQITNCSFDKLNDAYSALQIVLSSFTSIESYIDEAMAAIKDTPEFDKLGSIMDSSNDLRVEVKKISDELHKRMFPKGVQ